MTGTALLHGIRVLDLSRVMSGPYCTALLADLGAEVIKIESPGTGDDSRRFGPYIDDESVYFALLNRNKKSVTLNLKSEEGRTLLGRLAAECDVVVENFRPGVAARLHCDAARLRALNPRLVYLSISGFGQDGPLADWPAYDLVIQAMSGLMSITGAGNGPPTAAGESVADVCTGMFGAWAILAALFHRERTGEGQTIDVAMLDSLLAMQLTGLARLLAGGRAPQRVGNRHPVTAPVDTYATADGYIAMVVPSDAQFAALADVIGQPALAADPRFASNAGRHEHYAALAPLIETWTRSHPGDEAVRRLQARGIPAGPVWDLSQAYGSQQARHRGVLQETNASSAAAAVAALQPARFSNAAGVDAPEPAPRLGEHTAQVLAELLQIDAAAMIGLRDKGVV